MRSTVGRCWLVVSLAAVAFALPAGAQEENQSMGWCLVAGSSAASLGSVSSRIVEYPGVTCVMNVGVLGGGDYGLKVPSCSGLTGRRQGLLERGVDCDTIGIIELNSDVQCHCACNQPQSALEQQICEANDWQPDAARCEACRGCRQGATGAGSCRQQAEEICPPSQYEIDCADGGNVVSPIGCDCTCRKKGPCSVTGSSCRYEQVRPPDLRCGNNNSAGCALCDGGPGIPSMAVCTMHPDHCGDWSTLGFFDKSECLHECGTELVSEVLALIAGYDYKRLAGDWNCSATRGCIPPLTPDVCPFLGMLQANGLELCGSAPYFPTPWCDLDFVYSNWCGCNGETQHFYGGLFTSPTWSPNYDHPTLVFGTKATYTLYDQPIIEAHSSRTCGGFTSTSSTSDWLGAQCALSGWSPASCTGTGRTSRGMLMFKRRNDCPEFYEQFGYPVVLACDEARATSTASCGPVDSADTAVTVTIEDATASASASCSGGCPETETSPPVLKVKRDEALPLVVNGEESLVVTRIWSRDYGPTVCRNTWPALCGPAGTQPPVCGTGGGSSGGGGTSGGGGSPGGGLSTGALVWPGNNLETP